MKTKILTILLLALFCAQYTKAQSDGSQAETQLSKHSLGLGVGFSSGIGISYRYIPNNFGAQITVGGYFDQTLIEAYDCGFTFLYRLKSKPKSNFFLYQGNHLISSTDLYDNKTKYTNIHGLGLGIEFIILRNIGLNTMGCLLVKNESYTNDTFVGAGVDIGIYYKF